MQINMQINILGSPWTIEERSEKDDPRLEDCDGYTDWTTHEIVIEREVQGNLSNMEAYIRKVKRHEIVHAYAFECGLAECSSLSSAWAESEEMIDWIARIGPKIYNTWVEAGAVLPEDYTAEQKKKSPPSWFEKAYKENADKAIQRLLEEVKYRVEHPENECPFCGSEARAMVTWKGAPFELKKMEPLPGINLTTGQRDAADPPFMALAIETDDGEDYIGIKYCPICGKYLDAAER